MSMMRMMSLEWGLGAASGYLKLAIYHFFARERIMRAVERKEKAH